MARTSISGIAMVSALSGLRASALAWRPPPMANASSRTREKQIEESTTSPLSRSYPEAPKTIRSCPNVRTAKTGVTTIRPTKLLKGARSAPLCASVWPPMCLCRCSPVSKRSSSRNCRLFVYQIITSTTTLPSLAHTPLCARYIRRFPSAMVRNHPQKKPSRGAPQLEPTPAPPPRDGDAAGRIDAFSVVSDEESSVASTREMRGDVGARTEALRNTCNLELNKNDTYGDGD